MNNILIQIDENGRTTPGPGAFIQQIDLYNEPQTFNFTSQGQASRTNLKNKGFGIQINNIDYYLDERDDIFNKQLRDILAEPNKLGNEIAVFVVDNAVVFAFVFCF